MKKNIPSNLIQYFLKNSPNKVATRSKAIMPFISINMKHIPNDYMFIEEFLFKINCDYLTTEQYFSGRPQPSRLLSHLQNVPTIQNSSNNQSRKNVIQSHMIQSIKKLNENKDKPTIFLESAETVQMMNAEEAHKYKKYLIYLYKWTINQNKRLPQITSDLNEQLKKVVVDKIYEGHQQSEQRKNVQEELKRIQTLAKAREGLAKGDSNEAKTNYQAIFQDENNDPNSRMEALEYLCKQSIQKGDEGYLLGMMTKIPDNGKQERHKKYIMSTIEKMNKSNVTKLQTEKGND